MTITSTGLISGLDIESIVESLMAIERQPIDRLETQIETLTAEQTAFATLSAQILSLKTTVTPLQSGVNFRLNTATSSNEGSLSAIASSDAVPGDYTFTVKQVAQNHQMISKGFYDADDTAIGTGTISFELGSGNLDKETELSQLKGQEGIRRGEIQITDRSGSTATIDLSTALTMTDVLDAINEASGIDVTARVEGDSLVIEDNSGSTSQNLTITDLNDGYTASDLGIKGSFATGTVTGDDLVSLTDSVALKSLNDGNGVRTNGVASDMQITLSDGTSFGVDLDAALNLDTSLSVMNSGQGIREGSILITNKAGATDTIDLTGVETINDVLDALNNSALDINASWVNGSQFAIVDNSEGDGDFSIEDVDGGSTATDLGLDIIGNSNTSGADIFKVTTIGDAAMVIEEAARLATGSASSISVNLAADGKRLEFTDNTGGAGDVTIESVMNSNVAEDLGLSGVYSTSTITGERLVAGLNTVLLNSLNGGAGVDTGIIEIQDRSGVSKSIDLSNAETLDDVLSAINNDSDLSVEARLNDAKTGIIIEDTSGSTAANFKISDVDSSMASDLKISADQMSNIVDSGNNQLQYISTTTKLSELRSGEGIAAGAITITDSLGKASTLTLSSSDVADMSVGELITQINGLACDVTATINENGDGIMIVDNAGGTGKLTIGNEGTGSTASDLNIEGEADAFGSGGSIDGSFEYSVSIGGSDTLSTLIEKINDLGAGIQASLVNDGSSGNAYHLSLTSEISGLAGSMIINTGDLDLGLYNISEAQDAVIALGSGEGNSIIASSNTNTFDDLVDGLTLEAESVSSNPVTITVDQNVDSITEKMNAFVESFNTIFSTIDELTAYDADTQVAALLLGDSTINMIESRLLSAVTQTMADSGNFRRLSQLGISLGSGMQLEFDEDEFRSAMEANSEAVENFFADKELGFAYIMDEVIEGLTDTYDGLITNKTDGYDNRINLLSDRAEYLEELLEGTEARLYQSYQYMESALAEMQTMTSALESMSLIDNDSDD